MRKAECFKVKAEGSLSVFFSMMFPVVLLLFLALLAAGRHRIAESAIERDAALSSFSMTAEYQADVVREYGLYEIPAGRIASSYAFYLDLNRSHPFGSYEVADLSVSPEKTLADPAVLEEQIVHFVQERVLVDSMEEILALFSELGEAKEMQKEYIRYCHSQELMLIQMNYSDLITDIYGIREDGGRNEQAILTFLKGSLKLPDLIAAAQKVEEILLLEETEPATEDALDDDLSELYDQILVLEQGKDQIETTLYLIDESKDLIEVLIDQIADLKAREQVEEEEWESDEEYERLSDRLPVDESKLSSVLQILEKNEKLLENAQRVLDIYLAEEVPVNGPGILGKLSSYEYEIRLPHESRPVSSKLDISRLWDYLRGYGVDVKVYAPDQEKTPPFGNGSIPVDGSEMAEVSPADLELDLEMGGLLEHFLTEEYALGMFTNLRDTILAEEGVVAKNLRGDKIPSRFFTNEIEFLVSGQMNEYKNVNGTKNKIMVLRVLLNMLHLLTDPEKRQEIEQAAALTGGILLPGLGDLAAFGMILIAWSTFEAAADFRLLSKGGRVPILKDPENWQTDLFSLLGGDLTEEEVLETTGMSYREYLRVILLLTDEELLLTRIQTLLQTDEKLKDLRESVVTFRVMFSAVPSDGWNSSMFYSGVFGYE